MWGTCWWRRPDRRPEPRQEPVRQELGLPTILQVGVSPSGVVWRCRVFRSHVEQCGEPSSSLMGFRDFGVDGCFGRSG